MVRTIAMKKKRKCKNQFPLRVSSRIYDLEIALPPVEQKQSKNNNNTEFEFLGFLETTIIIIIQHWKCTIDIDISIDNHHPTCSPVITLHCIQSKRTIGKKKTR